MFKKLCLVLLLIPVIAFAQSSGKIAGVVVDKSTGEPLPGVNVILEGTTLGSSTDIDGYYVILNIPVSTYSIRANYIGYKDVLVEGIRVSASITTELNFDMEPTTLELEEAIVITAERPLVEKNVTQSISLVTSQEIEAMPVRGFNNLIQLQNSVVVQDGNVHIRGGRLEETGYYLDGASTMNILTNRNASYVIQEAIEEFQVLAGGYNAEFGGANSGIIRTEMKTGGSDYHFSVDAQTDKFVNQEKKFLGAYSYQHHVLVGTMSGPILSNKIRFFLAAENTYQGDDQVRFSTGYAFENIPDIASNRPNDTLLTVWYPDGYTPQNKTNQYSLNGSLLFDYSPIKVRFSGTYSINDHTYPGVYHNNGPYETAHMNLFNNRLITDVTTSLLFNTKATYIVSPTSYADLTFSYFNYDYDREDDYFGNDWQSWFDSTKVAQHTGGDVTFRDAWREEYEYNMMGFLMNSDGHPVDRYTHLQQSYLGGAVNWVSQIGRHHEARAGVDVRSYTVRSFAINPSVMLYTADPAYGAAAGYGTTYGSIQNVPEDTWVLQGNVASYGYDIYGNSTSNTIDYGNGVYVDAPRKPLFFSAYLQDKIEFNDLIINAGLRMDYFDSDDKTLRDPADPRIDANSGLVLQSEWVELDPFIQVSPRLGLSFPITEKTVFYSQYGKFIQMPSLNQVYFGNWTMSRQIRGGFYYQNPIGFGLEPERTTSYEIGFRQQLSNYAAIDIAGFYKNIKGQIQVDKETVLPTAQVQDYERFVNGDFATTKGLEFRLTLRRTARVQSQINYTLTNAKGTGSNNTAYHGAVYRDTQRPTIIQPLDYSQTHTGSIVLDYRFGKNDGGPILERLGANFLFTFSSGHPFTKVYAPPGGQVDPYVAGVDYMTDTRSRQALEPLGSSRTPWISNLDIRLDKTFTVFKNLDITMYARVLNVLNAKNVLNVYELTGSASDDGFLSDPARYQPVVDGLQQVAGEQYGITNAGEIYTSMYRAINLENGGVYAAHLGRRLGEAYGNELWGNPRQIFLGLKLNF
ncbi:MAG: TonB-dependent receptor [bacterium]|nr:MAG: TonB-dependent receptor [bacterium]